MSIDELANEQRLTKVEESVKSAHLRINNIESMQREIRDLALSVNSLACTIEHVSDNVSHVAGDVKGVCQRVSDIEAKPARRLDQIITIILSALITGALGFWLGQILK